MVNIVLQVRFGIVNLRSFFFLSGTNIGFLIPLVKFYEVIHDVCAIKQRNHEDLQIPADLNDIL